MGRIDECLMNQKTGYFTTTKKKCKNNCSKKECKYIGGRHNKIKPIDRPHNKDLKASLIKGANSNE